MKIARLEINLAYVHVRLNAKPINAIIVTIDSFHLTKTAVNENKPQIQGRSLH